MVNGHCHPSFSCFKSDQRDNKLQIVFYPVLYLLKHIFVTNFGAQLHFA